jgi:hypothetical protein
MLPTQASRQLAYEMAVGVCDADGAHGTAEQDFLSRLATALDLPVAVTGELNRRADEMAHAASDEGKEAHAAPVSGAVLGKSNLSETELEEIIRKAAITNAALELLPEGLSSMAIIPLQMRMVSARSRTDTTHRDHAGFSSRRSALTSNIWSSLAASCSAEFWARWVVAWAARSAARRQAPG